MRLTPLDIQKHRFSTRWKGLDPGEVEAFMRLVAEDYEALVRENESQRERLKSLEARVEELAANEKTLQDTLVTAQAVSDDLRRTAVKESEVRVSEAELQAEKIVEAAHRQAARLKEDIREMKRLRTRVAAAIRATIESHLRLLDGLAQDAPAEAEPRRPLAERAEPRRPLASASARRPEGTGEA